MASLNAAKPKRADDDEESDDDQKKFEAPRPVLGFKMA